jgi:hypothetical protein
VAFALQNGQNLGWNLFTLCFAALGLRFSKNFLCLQPHWLALFCPFSSEAVGLTGFQ